MDAPQHKNVYMALAAAQLAMEPVIKGAVNPAFKGEGKPKGTAYADLADVVSAVRPALAENGLAYFHQMVIFNEAPAMRTVICHGETDTSVSCDIPLIVAANNMQGMKSATTYAKRIGLESVTGVAPEDDDGNAAVRSPPVVDEKPKQEPLITTDQFLALRDKAELANVEESKIAAMAGIDDLRQLPAALFEGTMKKLQLTIDKQKPAADLGGDMIPY